MQSVINKKSIMSIMVTISLAFIFVGCHDESVQPNISTDIESTDITYADSFLQPPNSIMMDTKDFYRYYTIENILCADTNENWLLFIDAVMDDNHSAVERMLKEGSLFYVDTYTECIEIESINIDGPMNGGTLSYYEKVEITSGERKGEIIYTILNSTFPIDEKPRVVQTLQVFDLDENNNLIFYESNYTNGEALVIPSEINGVAITAIPSELFIESNKISTVVISEGITLIEEGAFKWSTLKEVTLPNSLAVIEEDAFFATDLENIDLPNSIESIGNNAFAFCELENLILTKNIELGTGVFWGNESLISIELPKNMPSIPQRTFSGCVSLQSIIFSENLSFIGADAFKNCDKILPLNLNSGVSVEADSPEIFTPPQMEHEYESISLVYSEVTTDDGEYWFAVGSAEDIVRERLISPNTAEFPRDGYVVERSDDNWRVSGFVDAQNMLGVAIREYWIATFRLGDISGTEYNIYNYYVEFK